ncbi:DUF6773 family protein [Candidatus Latescibacterota bacterium]
MIVDERIKDVRNRAAAGGFGIMYIFLLFDLLLRQFYFKQQPDSYWDIMMIWFAASLYVGIKMYSSGMMSGRVGQQFKVMIPVIFITIIATFYFMGEISSVHDVIGLIVGIVPTLLILFLFYNYLNRRWEKKNEMDE